VTRAWQPIGKLPVQTRLSTDEVQLRNALVAAFDYAVGPKADRRLQAVRARLALDIMPYLDGTPAPPGMGLYLNLTTKEIYGYRKTLTIQRDNAYQAVIDKLKVCLLLRKDCPPFYD
jgi:hypothetical protein